MAFSYIFIFHIAIFVLYGVNTEYIPAKQRLEEEPLDIGLDSSEKDFLASEDNPDAIDSIIQQRRKTVDELLNNFREDMKREQENENNKRSIHAGNPKYSNNTKRAVDENIENLKNYRNFEDLSDEGNVVSYRGLSANNSGTITESNPDTNLQNGNIKERTYASDVKDNRNSEQESNEILKNPIKDNRKQNGKVKQGQDIPKGKGLFSRHSIKADNFNANLQDYDDENDYFTIGEKPRYNYGNTPNFVYPRRFKNYPYTCCLCDECRSLDTVARDYLSQHYVKSNTESPTESEHFTGDRQKDKFVSFKYPVREQDTIKTIQLKSYENVPDRDFNFQIDNASPIDPYAMCRNNLSHEADYKLSKLEQDPGEKQKNLTWLWPKWGVQKRNSLQFNPMNEIKLKTSSRLMQRGFGPSLPSYSLGENRQEYMIDNILKQKELDFQKGNGNYHNLGEEVRGVADLADLRSPKSWNDFETSKVKPNTFRHDLNHILKKRSEKLKFKENDRDTSLRDGQRFNSEEEENIFNSNLASQLSRGQNLNNIGTSSQEISISNDLKSVENTNHRSRRSKRSVNTICPERRSSNHNMKKRNAPFKDPYEDYNAFHEYRDFNAGHDQDLIGNDMESLNKDVRMYKTERDHNENLNRDLYKRNQQEIFQQNGRNIHLNKRQEQNLNDRRDINNVLLLNRTGYMDTGKNLRFKQPPNNYENQKSEFDSKWKESNFREKKFARTPHRRPLKKKKGNSITKGRVGTKVAKDKLVPSSPDSNKVVTKSATFNMDNFNKFDNFHDYSNKNWPQHLDKHYPDLRYRSAALGSGYNISGFSSTDSSKIFPETSSVPSSESDESQKISLELRNEILNCTAYSSLDKFLNALPKNITQQLTGTTSTEGYEEIKMDLTTLDIKEFSTENPAWTTTELAATQDPYTEMEDTSESTDYEPSKAPESWETTPLDCFDITELPNSTTDTSSEEVESSASPMPNYDDSSSCDDSILETTTTPKSLSASSSLGPQSDDVKLNITIKANVEGNSKNNNFKGNGTINVKPGFEDNRYGRHVQKRKVLHRPKARPSYYDDDLLNDLSSGKLSANIVNAVFGEVQENPHLKVLWPSLKRNQLNGKNTPLPNFYSIRDKYNEDQIQHSENLMAKTMDAINDIIDQQVRTRSCVVLRPELQDFYDLIVKTSQQQENRREKRENSKEKLSTKGHASIPDAAEDKTKTVKKLLRQYEELSQEEQQKVKPIHEILLSELSKLESLKDDLESQTRDMEDQRNHGAHHDNDDMANLLKKYYTPQFLKLKKASDLYRSITNESDDGMP